MQKKELEFENREISWLAFNERVLQEAEDPTNPLRERFKFLGIYSNNADEFYRVRVASLRRLSFLSSKLKSSLLHHPKDILKDIQELFIQHQKRFEKTYRMLKEDARQFNIHIIDEKKCNVGQKRELSDYFHEVVRTSLVPIMLDKKNNFPQLKDKGICLAIKLSNVNGRKVQYALIEVPSKTLPRFKVLKAKDDKTSVIMLEDIIRLHLKDIFSIFHYELIEAYTIKLTRDAELDFDDDLSMSMIDQLSKSLVGRKTAIPIRFIFDKTMPEDLKKFLFQKLKLKEGEHTIAGGKYHNFKDFIDFPSLDFGQNKHEELPPIKHPAINGNSVMSCIKKQDVLVNYPYHSFSVIIDLLREAAIDPEVKRIQINLYRVAKNSKIINALINAVKNGKKVVAIVELRARFDEENNIYWANKLKAEGVEVLFGVPGLKVHSKLILISRKERGKLVLYGHVGTGNFNEGTAKLYTDASLLTADVRITSEIARVFDFFANNFKIKRYSHLIISPTGTRRKFIKLIQNEIKNANKGLKAEIILKLNNLADPAMIKKLVEAGKAGVKVKLIIRSTCCILAGAIGSSKNITAISVVDRFLEHTRILVFKNAGDEKVYLSSADWMTRNLDRRVEVSVPIYDKKLQKTLLNILKIKLSDNCKARHLEKGKLNTYVKTKGVKVRSQLQEYKFFKNEAD